MMRRTPRDCEGGQDGGVGGGTGKEGGAEMRWRVSFNRLWAGKGARAKEGSGAERGRGTNDTGYSPVFSNNRNKNEAEMRLGDEREKRRWGGATANRWDQRHGWTDRQTNSGDAFRERALGKLRWGCSGDGRRTRTRPRSLTIRTLEASRGQQVSPVVQDDAWRERPQRLTQPASRARRSVEAEGRLVEHGAQDRHELSHRHRQGQRHFQASM